MTIITQQEEANKKNVERIYIGGLDPDRLSIREILDRFPAHVKIEALSHPDTNPCYCHLSAYLLRQDNDKGKNAKEEASALGVLQKLFHNVKWKGCKLQVQGAKPHFMQRLQAERKERTRPSSTLASSSGAAEKEDEGERTTSSTLRRFCRIRYAYGKPAWMVDTKPYQVSDGKVFGKMVQHVRKRKNDDNTGDAATRKNKTPKQKKPFRAVHWRFTEDDDGDDNTSDREEMNIISQKTARKGEDSSATSVSSSDDDSSLVSTSSECDNQHTQKRYVWSDEDDESARSTKSLGSENVGTNEDNDLKDNIPERESRHTSEIHPGGYVWSDDESSASSTDRSVDSRTKRMVRPFSAQDNSLDEFAAALDDDNESPMESNTKHDDDISYNADTTSDAANTMEEDEERNIKILAA
eukprot:scaffold19787_cov196-Amphora_coffeaeformis.AAC.1